MAILLLLGGSSALTAQVAPAVKPSAEMAMFAAFGAQKTHVIDDNFNSLGIEVGGFVQWSRFMGLEVKGDVFPFFARYKQAPMTGGYRFAFYPRTRTLPGVEIFGYGGAGVAKAQSAGNHYETLNAQWSPCWQVSQGVNIPIGHRMMWKAYEATFTETFTPARTLWSFSGTTGITFILNGER